MLYLPVCAERLGLIPAKARNKTALIGKHRQFSPQQSLESKLIEFEDVLDLPERPWRSVLVEAARLWIR